MKLTVNGIDRKAEIFPTPQGAFCIIDGGAFPAYPMCVAVCEAAAEEEKQYGDVLICPVFGGNGNYGNLSDEEVKTEVCEIDVRELLATYKEEYDGNTPLKEATEEIMREFKIHGTPVTKSAKDYVAKIMCGAITEFPEPIKRQSHEMGT